MNSKLTLKYSYILSIPGFTGVPSFTKLTVAQKSYFLKVYIKSRNHLMFWYYYQIQAGNPFSLAYLTRRGHCKHTDMSDIADWIPLYALNPDYQSLPFILLFDTYLWSLHPLFLSFSEDAHTPCKTQAALPDCHIQGSSYRADGLAHAKRLLNVNERSHRRHPINHVTVLLKNQTRQFGECGQIMC